MKLKEVRAIQFGEMDTVPVKRGRVLKSLGGDSIFCVRGRFASHHTEDFDQYDLVEQSSRIDLRPVVPLFSGQEEPLFLRKSRMRCKPDGGASAHCSWRRS